MGCRVWGVECECGIRCVREVKLKVLYSWRRRTKEHSKNNNNSTNNNNNNNNNNNREEEEEEASAKGTSKEANGCRVWTLGEVQFWFWEQDVI